VNGGYETDIAFRYTGDDLVGNVAYDLFTSSTDTGEYKYEFMIWLDALGGAVPLSTTGKPIATATLLGKKWEIWKGTNSARTVFTFVAKSAVTSFSGDLMEFIYYLIDNNGVSKSQIIRSIGAGTEAFTGSNAVFTTSQYSAVVEYY
jgi:xyloglucan-specific endo-beta-1,4-glucanase